MGQLLILVFSIILIMLPVAVLGINQILDIVLLQQSQQYLEQTILAVYGCMIPESLAIGQPRLSRSKAEAVLRQEFRLNLPASLENSLLLTELSFVNNAIPMIEDHWMGADQPRFVPVVTMHAEYVDHQGRHIPLHHTIELIID